MKKVFSFFLVLVLVFCSASAALADTFTAGSTEVSLTVDRAADSYIVTIPASVEIDPATQTGETQIVLKSGFQLIACNSLKVRISGFANSPWNISRTNNDCFILQSEDDSKCSYSISAFSHWDGSQQRTLITTNSSLGAYAKVYEYDLIRVTKATANTDCVARLLFSVPSLPSPGTYTDTITFDIILE